MTRFFGVILAGLCGCSTAASPAQPTADSGIKDSARDVVIEDAAPPPSCDEVKACTSNPPANSTCLVSFDATLVDATAQPIANESIYICGKNICTSPIPSNAQGKIHASACLWFVGAAFKYLGRTKYASFATGLPDGQPAIVVPQIVLTPLPAQGVDLPTAGGDVVSNLVTLTVAPSSFSFDPGEPQTADLHQFRAVEVPIASAPPLVDPTLKLEVFWGLGPVNAALSPPGALKVPNSKKWAPNAIVEFFLNGVDLIDVAPPAPYGKWAPIGTGHVSADGKTVSTDTGPGNGLPMISMVGIRLKQ